MLWFVYSYCRTDKKQQCVVLPATSAEAVDKLHKSHKYKGIAVAGTVDAMQYKVMK